MTFRRGEKVVFDGKTYDFGYMIKGDFGYVNKEDHAVIYEEGESNMQDAIAVDPKRLTKKKLENRLPARKEVAKITQERFRVHTANLLKEIADCGLPRTTGIMKIPLNQFRIYLLQVATRASQLNDPILNRIMCDMTLYDIADPESKDYNPKALEEVYKRADTK